MTKLATLRSRLGRLRRLRATVRVGSALAAVGIAVLWILGAAFLIDWTFEMSRPQRLVSLVLCAGVGYWAYRRFAAPFLGQRETDLDMALLVERQQEIDSDLVAALQFESAEASKWGSPQLERAVIDYVAEFGENLNVFEGFSQRQLVRRGSTFAVTTVAVLIAVILYPGHAGAFLNRFLLGSRHYPTRTVIERIVINGKTIYPSGETLRVASPYGRPLRFEVYGSGELPAQGRATLMTHRERVESRLDLVPRGRPGQQGVQVFTGELTRLVDSLTWQLYLGDAWTDPADLEVLPLPIVTVDLQPTPPAYAASSENAAEERLGTRQIAVLEGSRVDVRLVAANKPLRSAVLTIEDRSYPLQAEDEKAMVWRLPAEGTPLANVTAPVRYQIQVRDRDDLELEQPVQGFIRIKTDRHPRVVAAMISRNVLPTARPRISYGATDDYGIAQLRMVRQVVREEGPMEETVEDIVELSSAGSVQTALRGDYVLDLASLQLKKGDQVKVTLEAVDYRGDVAGKSAFSEPLVLQVTDIQGFLAGMVESDEQSARRLDVIIQRQLGIGDSP